MVFSLGEIINRASEGFSSSGVVNTLSSNIFIATAIMLIIILIIIIAVVNQKIDRKRIIKLLLYIGISIMVILTIHYYALSARLKRDYQKETNRVIYDKINDINTSKRIPVVPNFSIGDTPFGAPAKESFRHNSTVPTGSGQPAPWGESDPIGQGALNDQGELNDQDEPNELARVGRGFHGGREDNILMSYGDSQDLSDLGLNTIKLPD